jgi:hypothetical protein
VTLALAFLVFGGFVAVFLVARHRKHRQAAVPIQRTDLNPPADPDTEPADWPPTR